MRKESINSKNKFCKLLEIIQKNKKNEEISSFIEQIKKKRDLSINAEAEFGGPKVGLSIQSEKFVVNLLVDLRTKILISIFKRFNNGEKNKRCK